MKFIIQLFFAIGFLILVLCLPSRGQTRDTALAKKPHFVIGTFYDFELLVYALSNRDDVTNNQIKYLIEWIKTLKAVPEEKKEEKKPK